MPILPIDVQTMLSQLDQVGKEHAARKEGAPQAQSLQALELVRQAEQSDHSVNQTRDMGEGPDKVEDERERARQRKHSRSREGRAGGRPEDSPIIEDPELGRHIDLTG